jgi:hypothetical protein
MTIRAYTPIEVLGPSGGNLRRGTACAGDVLIATAEEAERDAVDALVIDHFR